MAAYAVPIMIASTVLQLYGAHQQRQQAKYVGGQKAKQLEKQAEQTIAISQRKAIEEEKRKDLIASRALALAAFSGGAVSDPSTVKLLGDIEGEGAYRKAAALYSGEQEAKALREEASLARTGVAMGGSAHAIGQLSTVLSGATSVAMAQRYGGPSNVGADTGPVGVNEYVYNPRYR